MSKSILVIDAPMQVCQKCKLCYECENDDCMCAGTGKIIPDGEKPDWCSLRDFPDKKDIEPGKTIIRASQHKGWNMCIDEILKGARRNERSTY